MKNKIIIAGSRDLKNMEYLTEKMDALLKNLDPGSIQIISGGQMSLDKDTGEMYGADFLGEQYANNKNLSIKRVPANWDLYGAVAGPIRNQEMASIATHLVAFPMGESKGTRNMIKHAKNNSLIVRIYEM